MPMTVKTLSDVSEVTHFKWDPVISWRRMGQRGKEEKKKVASFIQMQLHWEPDTKSFLEPEKLLSTYTHTKKKPHESIKVGISPKNSQAAVRVVIFSGKTWKFAIIARMFLTKRPFHSNPALVVNS